MVVGRPFFDEVIECYRVQLRNMITLEDCIGLRLDRRGGARHRRARTPPRNRCNSTRSVPFVPEHGSEKVRDMIVDDFRQAQLSGDKEHVVTLLHVLHHFLKTHPEASPSDILGASGSNNLGALVRGLAAIIHQRLVYETCRPDFAAIAENVVQLETMSQNAGGVSRISPPFSNKHARGVMKVAKVPPYHTQLEEHPAQSSTMCITTTIIVLTEERRPISHLYGPQLFIPDETSIASDQELPLDAPGISGWFV